MSVKEAVSGFTFGCDPELFIVDKGGNPVPAAGIIPGTKEKPHRVKRGAVQVDGMAAEFNTTPAKSFAEWNRNIEVVMGELRGFLPEGHSFSERASVVFPKEIFDKAPDEAKELGCMPDFDAWTGKVNPPPADPDNPYMRCAAGHLHIGWGRNLDLGDEDHVLNCREICQQFDWHLGVWSTRLDKDPTRRRLYGKAGAFRPKEYGVEYRVLSNFWIFNQNRRLAVWNRMQNAILDMRKAFLPEVYQDDNERVRQSINATLRDTALENAHRYPITADNPKYPYGDIAMAG